MQHTILLGESMIINFAIIESIFANKAKGAFVIHVDKGGKDKDTFSNYRPISVLNTVLKITQLSTFDQFDVGAS